MRWVVPSLVVPVPGRPGGRQEVKVCVIEYTHDNPNQGLDRSLVTVDHWVNTETRSGVFRPGGVLRGLHVMNTPLSMMSSRRSLLPPPHRPTLSRPSVLIVEDAPSAAFSLPQHSTLAVT